jgi:hypothetical protein
MSRTFHDGSRRIRVRGIRRKQPDLRKLGLALLDIVQAEAEAQAAAEHRHRQAENDGKVVELRPRKTAEGPERDAA